MDQTDVLSDVFSTLRLNSHLYFRAELRGDFSVELPGERRHIRFHLVRRGQCWLTLPDGQATRVGDGDIAIVPNGARQVLSAAPALPAIPLPQLLVAGALQDGVLRHGTGDRPVDLLCGFCAFDEAIAHPLLASLPELITLRMADLGQEPWVTAALRLLAMEADLNGQGTTAILARLLEILLVQAVRRITPIADGPAAGYIAALSDPQLSRALVAMHTQPQADWKVGDLAKLAGMSRARFADRFTTVVGVPPIGYLTTWRLTKARALLATSGLDMAEIAARCGYASVPSFTRRFKAAFGLGPGAYRRAARSG